MAGYDPKRPRPTADGDEPAPVDALLDTGSVEAVTIDEPSSESRPEPELASPAPESSPAPGLEPEPVAVADDASPVDRHLRSVPESASTVPVAERPAEPTANRAVLFVGAGAAALVALVLVVILRRRRR